LIKSDCFKLNPKTKKWERTGRADILGKYWVSIPTKEVVSIKKAPAYARTLEDYGLSSLPPNTRNGKKDT